MSSPSDRRCIYCKESKEKWTKEHVVPYALGGGMTLAEGVCEDCNCGPLSVIDTQLAHFSILALGRIGEGPGGRSSDKAKSKFTCLYPEPSSGDVIEVWLEQGFIPITKPQFIVDLESGKATFRIDPKLVSGDYLEAFKDFLSALKNFGFDRVKIVTETWNQEIKPRVVRESSDWFYVRAKDAHQAQRLLRSLQDPANERRCDQPDSVGKASSSGQPVQTGIRMDMAMTYRAVAKIAFNFVAKKLGWAFALRSEFDPVRQFILKGPPLGSLGTFVAMGSEMQMKRLEGHHSLLLATSGSELAVREEFYGHFDFLVRVGPDSGPEEIFPALSYFDYRTRSVTDIPLLELGKHLVSAPSA